MSGSITKKLIAVGLAGALMVGTVGQALAAKPAAHYGHATVVKSSGVWQLFSRVNGTWD